MKSWTTYWEGLQTTTLLRKTTWKLSATCSSTNKTCSIYPCHGDEDPPMKPVYDWMNNAQGWMLMYTASSCSHVVRPTMQWYHSQRGTVFNTGTEKRAQSKCSQHHERQVYLNHWHLFKMFDQHEVHAKTYTDQFGPVSSCFHSTVDRPDIYYINR